MKKMLFICFAIISFSFISDNWWSVYLQQLDQFNNSRPYEKAYLHTDQTYYQPGDIIWFSAYLLNQQNQVSDISSVLYVDVIQPDSKVAKTLELSLSEGKAAGTLKLAAESTGGIYKLKAYTQWMKNFDEEYFFTKEITVYQYVPPQLLLKLDFDKENYAPGSEVKVDFSARSLDDQPIASQTFKYKISIDGQQVLHNEAITNQQGEAILTYQLAENLATTDALLNIVIADQGITESISRSIPIVLNKITVDFFPEGGDLVPGTEQQVAFKATNEFGKPADINGAIYDQEDNLVTTVSSYHMGMGKFSLPVTKNKNYYLKLTNPEIEQRYPLPGEFSDYGFSAVYDSQTGKVLINFQAPENRQVSLAAISAGQHRFFQTFASTQEIKPLEIDVAEWPIGITRFTLFDEAGNPQAERLLFLNKHKQLKIAIATDKESYSPREEVKLKITTRDESGNPLPANLSLAVANDQLISLADDKQANILAGLLLDTELQGEIKEPNFYFDAGESKADAALDLVMLTHGWRRFSWQEITSEDYLVQYLPEQYSTISGTIYNSKTLKPTKAKVYLVETGGKERVATVKTGNDGRFIFMNVETTHPLQLYGKTSLFKTNNVYIDLDGDYGTKGGTGNNASLIMQPDIQWLELDGFNNLRNATPSAPQAPDDVIGAVNQQISGAPASMALTADVKQLSELVVVGYGETSYSSLTGSIVHVNSQQILGSNINNALQGRIAGVQIVESSDRNDENRIRIRGINSLANNSPLFVVNGIAMSNLDLQQLVPDDIKTISIVKGAEATNLYGMQAANGVVIITTNNNIKRNRGGRLSPSKYTFMLLNGRIYHRAREFKIPDYHNEPVTKNKDDFRNTIYWNPEIITDKNGEAEVTFFNSDASTTFRITTEGIGAGLIGREEATYAVNDALDVQVKMPPYLTTSDSLLVSVNLKSNLNHDFSGTVSFTYNQYFQDLLQQNQSVNLAPQSFSTQYLTLKPVRPGKTSLLLNLDGQVAKQTIDKPVKILPIGFPVEMSWSSNHLQDTFKVNISDPVQASIDLSFIAYPNLMSDLFDGIESIIREPYGCFEQVSASTFPNIMALQYMQENTLENPEIKNRALGYIAKGYEKLIAYETSEGGYEWFGNLPPHEGLTAFGLLEFVAMEKVWNGMDKKTIDKTAQWLLSRKDGKGGFRQNRGKYAFARAHEEIVNAYIVYALSEAGYSKIDIEFQAALSSVNGKEDNYRKALLALAAFNLNKSEIAEKLLAEIKKSISMHTIAKLPASHSITYSMGKSLQVETASLCALAFMKSATPDIGAIQKIIDYIISQRSFGGFGSTQATVLGLQALVEYARLTKKSMDAGDITVFINGKMARQKRYGKEQTGNVEMSGLEKYLTTGSNEFIVKISSEQSEPLPYSLNLAYNSFTPHSSPTCLVDLTTHLSTERTELLETVRLTAELTNKHHQYLPMTMALVGIPAGLSLQPWQLKEMQEKDVFDYYEIIENYLVIYFSSLPAGKQTLHFDLKADFAGRFQAPASVAYLYYSKEDKDWERGEVIEVAVE